MLRQAHGNQLPKKFPRWHQSLTARAGRLWRSPGPLPKAIFFNAQVSTRYPRRQRTFQKASISQGRAAGNLDDQFASWTNEQVNNPDSIAYKWEPGTIKELLCCQTKNGAQTNIIVDWPLTLADFTPLALPLCLPRSSPI